MSNQLSVAVLGATGLVGQGIVALLTNHPRFRPAELIASPRSAGKRYGEAVVWREQTPLQPSIAALEVLGTDAEIASSVVFSSATSAVSTALETRYAGEGRLVISSASGHRMDAHVPLVVPEVNAAHLQLVQRGRGAIVTNCNCAAMFVAMVLAPLHRDYTVEAVQVTTLQAVSGAGIRASRVSTFSTTSSRCREKKRRSSASCRRCSDRCLLTASNSPHSR